MLKNKGFTLIELLIVIAIVAVLAGAMVPVFRVTRLEAQQARVAADLDTIKTASLMLHHDIGAGGWPALGNVGVGLVSNFVPANPSWRGPYMDEWKPDPWTRSYAIYDVAGTPTTRRVRSLGPDGVAGGTPSDDITLLITPDILM